MRAMVFTVTTGYWPTVQTVTAEHGLATGYVAGNWLAEGLLCVWCVSVWCAGLFMVLTLVPVLAPLVSFVSGLLAVSAASILAHELITYLKEH